MNDAPDKIHKIIKLMKDTIFHQLKDEFASDSPDILIPFV